MVNEKRISNIEQGMSNYEVSFDIRYSLFDIYPPIFCGGAVLFNKSLNP